MHRKYALNELCFEEPLTEEKLYWLGFLYADGHISMRESLVSLEIQERDSLHLNLFANFTGSTRPIKTRLYRNYKKGQNTVRLAFNSKHINARLRSFGVCEHKTFQFHVPNYIWQSRHFWRGVIDGDGHIRHNANDGARIELYGNEECCKSFSEFLKNNGILSSAAVHKKKSTNCFVFVIGGHLLARKVLVLLYEDSTISLERKKATASDLLNHVPRKVGLNRRFDKAG